MNFRLEKSPKENLLRDFTGQVLRVEALVCVEGLEKYLNSRVSLRTESDTGLSLELGLRLSLLETESEAKSEM